TCTSLTSHETHQEFAGAARSASVLFRTASAEPRGHADVAQLVERNLAKVEVASSSLVVRSERVTNTHPVGEWPRGEATDCKSVYEGSNPFSTSIRSSTGS